MEVSIKSIIENKHKLDEKILAVEAELERMKEFRQGYSYMVVYIDSVKAIADKFFSENKNHRIGKSDPLKFGKGNLDPCVYFELKNVDEPLLVKVRLMFDVFPNTTLQIITLGGNKATVWLNW